MKKRPRDLNQWAKRMVDLATGQIEEAKATVNETARKGGLKGGPARSAKLGPKRRTEIAKKAAQARWKSSKASS